MQKRSLKPFSFQNLNAASGFVFLQPVSGLSTFRSSNHVVAHWTRWIHAPASFIAPAVSSFAWSKK